MEAKGCLHRGQTQYYNMGSLRFSQDCGLWDGSQTGLFMEMISETFGDVLEGKVCRVYSRRDQLSALITFQTDHNILDMSSIRSRFLFFFC